jgi:hypothetical protein
MVGGLPSLKHLINLFYSPLYYGGPGNDKRNQNKGVEDAVIKDRFGHEVDVEQGFTASTLAQTKAAVEKQGSWNPSGTPGNLTGTKVASKVADNEKNLKVGGKYDNMGNLLNAEHRATSAPGPHRDIVRHQSSDDPFRFSTHAYPGDVVDDVTNGHYMLFYVNVQNKTKYSYDGVTESGAIVPVGDQIQTRGYWTESTGGPAGGGSKYIDKTFWSVGAGANKEMNTEIAYNRNKINAGAPGNHLISNMTELRKGRAPQTGLNSVYRTTTRITDSVAIYLPPNVENKTKTTYNDFETGMAGYLALGGSHVINKIVSEDYEGAASDFIGLGGTILVEALKKAAVLGVETFTGGEGVQESFDKAFGQTVNPYIEVAFQSMDIRSFSYDFHFAPRNEKETMEVRDIINLFRFHMLPELKGTNHRYLTLPSTFDIHYMYQPEDGNTKENPFYNKIATCVLTDCDVNYTPDDNVRSFDSGAPTKITMTLGFMETEMLTKQKVAQGF